MRKKGLRSTIAYLGLSLCLAGGLMAYAGPAVKFDPAPFEDVVEGVDSTIQIAEEEVPLAAPKVTTKTTTKTTTKKEKMSKAATKTSAKSSTKTTTSKNVTTTAKEKIEVETTVKTTVVTTQKKGSKTKTIKTTVKTTVKTTTTQITPATKQFIVKEFSEIKGYIDQDVYDAFVRLEFDYVVDPQLSSAGVFSVGNHWIKVKSPSGFFLMHELGHFVAALEKSAEKTSEWKSIYDAEKEKYTGSNKRYTISTASEYFAESFRDYSENPTALKKSRPKTYAYMDKIVKQINVEEDAKWFYNRYGIYWDSIIKF